jgi:hypothetical protein
VFFYCKYKTVTDTALRSNENTTMKGVINYSTDEANELGIYSID